MPIYCKVHMQAYKAQNELVSSAIIDWTSYINSARLYYDVKLSCSARDG